MDFINKMEIGTRVCFLGKWTSIWYMYDTRVYESLVHSHQSYLEATVGEELSAASPGLWDGVPGLMSGLMSGLTSGWINDPRMVGGPSPRRFCLLT
jgi:hypothetical protein